MYEQFLIDYVHFRYGLSGKSKGMTLKGFRN